MEQCNTQTLRYQRILAEASRRQTFAGGESGSIADILARRRNLCQAGVGALMLRAQRDAPILARDCSTVLRSWKDRCSMCQQPLRVLATAAS